MYNMYVGIDPSINNTGLTILIYDASGDRLYSQKFFVVTGNKLTKKQNEVQNKYSLMFEYYKYDKQDVHDTMNNIEREFTKTMNFIEIVNTIDSIIKKEALLYDINNITVCQEGISYGSSIRTKSVFDLAGLNYMIRGYFMKKDNINFIIATPSEIKKFATGSGVASKDLMLSMFKTFLLSSQYPDFDIPKMDDIADSYFMAKFAKEWKS